MYASCVVFVRACVRSSALAATMHVMRMHIFKEGFRNIPLHFLLRKQA